MKKRRSQNGDVETGGLLDRRDAATGVEAWETRATAMRASRAWEWRKEDNSSSLSISVCVSINQSHNAREDGLRSDEPGRVLPDALPAPPSVLRAVPVARLPRWREDDDLLPLDTCPEPDGVPPLALALPVLPRPPLPGVLLHPLLRLPQTQQQESRQGGMGRKPWNKECAVIEEEGLLDDDDSDNGLPRKCYLLAFLVGFFVLFSVFGLILWGASRPMKPDVVMKSIKFEQFVIQAGSDSTGVATDMVSMNSTVKLTFRNTATFFGVHVTATPVELSYSQLTIASGTLKKFYQSRKSQRTVTIVVEGNKIPLYGSGAGLSTPTGTTNLPVPLELNFVVRSKAYVLGKLVKPRFYKTIGCSVVLDLKKLNVPTMLKNCTYV
ncbi:hypothetical protein Sjap_017288 [Stephania japonica]|uniref:Late embryogenesis abundant protein LEA-2 subgroup domain-containing protein n=1 Tax=Stephania japonica TaxID=461633 RepID=A0AAP0I5W7_9MAGN